jgi:nucleotide-binding universal stress UspA family protein
MKNILIPCDFSKPAEEAFKFAVKLAGQSKGEIHVLYVIDITFLSGNPSLSHTYAFNVNFLKDIEQKADQKFQIMSGRYAPISLKVKFKRVISSLTLEVENYIKANNIDLVVMGTHGEGGATAIGSNTDKIVRNSSVPVLAVRTAPEHTKNIVFPLIPNQGDEEFIYAVKDLQSFFQAKLHLLYVNTPLIFKTDKESTDEMERFASPRFKNYSINIRSDYNVEAGITHFAKEINADMIAMGTHAWKGLAHYIIGSNAERIVDHLAIPIWTFHLA